MCAKTALKNVVFGAAFACGGMLAGLAATTLIGVFVGYFVGMSASLPFLTQRGAKGGDIAMISSVVVLGTVCGAIGLALNVFVIPPCIEIVPLTGLMGLGFYFFYLAYSRNPKL